MGEDGQGIFRRNSVTAREHNAELATLVLEVLIKKTWEVARESELRSNCNILPMGLVPKPGKTPPWQIINDGRECNAHASPSGMRRDSGIKIDPEKQALTAIQTPAEAPMQAHGAITHPHKHTRHSASRFVVPRGTCQPHIRQETGHQGPRSERSMKA